MYRITISPKAKDDLAYFKKSGQTAIVNKIAQLLKELSEHPKTGTGKPEQLKYDLSGYWSRRITQEHRMIYTIKEQDVAVDVVQLRTHYK